jgi:hypothetical protein
MNHHRRFRTILLGLILILAVAPVGLVAPAPVAASSLSTDTVSLSFAAPAPSSFINSLAVYDGKLYAGTCCASAIYVFDGTSWSLSFTADNADGHVHGLAVYKGKLYAGTNYYEAFQNRGRIYVYDGTNWSVSKDYSPANDIHHVFSFATYNGQLYAGTGDYGKVLVFDGTTWTDMGVSLAGDLYNMVVYNGKLYTAYDNVYVYDGTSWLTSQPSLGIVSLAVYNGKLYAGNSPTGIIYVYDGTTWAVSENTDQITIRSLAVFNNKLYAGTEPNGLLYVYDGTSWTVSHDFAEASISAFSEYNNSLYIGTNPISGISTDGTIYELTPDTTAPMITITTPANDAHYLLGATILADYTCQDEAGGSGLATCAGPVASGAAIDTASVGPKTFTVNATDVAGNPATSTHDYQLGYAFSGFYQPIDNTMPNAAKAGQTIPAKWRLTDANGNPISDPASFVSLTSSVTSGSCGVTADAIETYAGSSGLQYLGDGYWQFNWKTPKGYAGQCRTMSLNLNDGGSGRTATFIFK